MMTPELSDFKAQDLLTIEAQRARLEEQLFRFASEIAKCGLLPTITLNPVFKADKDGDLVPVTGEFEVEVDVRYGKTFYRDERYYEFIQNRIKAANAAEAANAPVME